MDLDFKQILKGSMGNENTVEHRFEGDALIISCMDCDLAPEPATKECMKCIVDRMSESGGAKRIVLRTGKDIEISGASGQMIRNISSMKRCSGSLVRNKGRCKRCPSSRDRAMEALWNDFPYPNYSAARGCLGDSGPYEMCDRCIASTQRTISQIESDLDEMRRGRYREWQRGSPRSRYLRSSLSPSLLRKLTANAAIFWRPSPDR